MVIFQKKTLFFTPDLGLIQLLLGAKDSSSLMVKNVNSGVAKKDKLRLDVSELLDGNNKPCHQEVHPPIPAEKVPTLIDSKPSLPALSSSVTIKHQPGRGRFAVNCI